MSQAIIKKTSDMPRISGVITHIIKKYTDLGQTARQRYSQEMENSPRVPKRLALRTYLSSCRCRGSLHQRCRRSLHQPVFSNSMMPKQRAHAFHHVACWYQQPGHAQLLLLPSTYFQILTKAAREI